MNKKIILVAAPPACGKNYVSGLICESVGNIVYLDKDDLGDLIARSFALGGQDVNMDGDFYLENLRDVEYSTLMKLAFSALKFSNMVLVNAPFLKEVRDSDYMVSLKKKAASLDAELILVWVVASEKVCYSRIKKRNSSRDVEKLLFWDEYYRKTNYTAPIKLLESGAVDELFIFENENDKTAKKSLGELLEMLGGKNA